MDPQAGTVVHEPRARALLVAILDAYPGWLRTRIHALVGDRAGASDAVERTVTQSTEWVADALTTLLASDPEKQRDNPLHVLRSASRFANQTLASMEVGTPQRDEFEQRAMPEDTYAIGPLAWIDLGQLVHEAGIEWGAWKAAVIISRRRQPEVESR